eukprot:TRINITY_DN1546_c1_g1_i1.p1 TRINITY_DN1546_c1_g1~~TRINITY_DN1546_c1_g1_i1.p1  ORF type:complete len:426 (+),score=-10.54 TRINITY_DN1546_c1_g1_i1:81-1358(+)
MHLHAHAHSLQMSPSAAAARKMTHTPRSTPVPPSPVPTAPVSTRSRSSRRAAIPLFPHRESPEPVPTKPSPSPELMRHLSQLAQTSSPHVRRKRSINDPPPSPGEIAFSLAEFLRHAQDSVPGDPSAIPPRLKLVPRRPPRRVRKVESGPYGLDMALWNDCKSAGERECDTGGELPVWLHALQAEAGTGPHTTTEPDVSFSTPPSIARHEAVECTAFELELAGDQDIGIGDSALELAEQLKLRLAYQRLHPLAAVKLASSVPDELLFTFTRSDGAASSNLAIVNADNSHCLDGNGGVPVRPHHQPWNTGRAAQKGTVWSSPEARSTCAWVPPMPPRVSLSDAGTMSLSAAPVAELKAYQEAAVQKLRDMGRLPPAQVQAPKSPTKPRRAIATENVELIAVSELVSVPSSDSDVNDDYCVSLRVPD